MITLQFILKLFPIPIDKLSWCQEKGRISSLEDDVNSLQEEERKLKKGEATIDMEDCGAYVVASKVKKCFECGKTGRVAKDCQTKNPCSICGQTNHRSSRCYFKDKTEVNSEGQR